MANSRLQFEFSEGRVEDMDSLIERCDLSTRKMLFDYALTLVEWMVSEAEQGHEIAAINRDTKQFFTLRTPLLDAVKRRVASEKANKKQIRLIVSEDNQPGQKPNDAEPEPDEPDACEPDDLDQSAKAVAHVQSVQEGDFVVEIYDMGKTNFRWELVDNSGRTIQGESGFATRQEAFMAGAEAMKKR